MTQDSTERIREKLQELVNGSHPGTKLPSNRALVKQYGASPVTVQKAMSLLAAQGIVESRPGVGTFVLSSRSHRGAPANDYRWQTGALSFSQSRLPSFSTALKAPGNDVISLHSGYPAPELLPTQLVRTAFSRAGRSETSTTRSPSAGLPELQAWFANELAEHVPTDGVPPTASNVIIVPGSQSGLSMIFRALVGPERPLLTESPTYWGAILAAAHTNTSLIPLPSDAHGPDPDELDAAFEQTGARAFYAQPNYANPTGAQWSLTRTHSIMEVIRRHGAFLIEDDWAHDFGITTQPTPAAAFDRDGHVVYVRSLTKSVSPSVRVAAVIVRGPARDRMLRVSQAESMYVSASLQSIALDVVSQPTWRTHLRGLRTQLCDRRDLLASSLHEHLPEANIDAIPTGGLNLWVRLPDLEDLEEFVRRCEIHGVIVAPGDEWFPAEPPGSYLRLNYSGPRPGEFPEAARLIAEALSDCI
ncbi:aminotransferase-like domain-containing protein [Nesterenkonia ebinurensis]|uniref:aminotransferase-like domain-containing protein n=1 Tax=Nesterenkonia ebinurensis TaxID=2608252 RepID=UPI00123DEAFF|nr:PLP-dependent aminotransferase family protein [Nesterenkonia ebinurensis]